MAVKTTLCESWRAKIAAGTFLVACSCTALTVHASPPPVLYAAGSVNQALELPDGSRIVAGNFTSVNGTPRAGLAKLDATGHLDAAWNPAGLPSGTGAQAVALAASPDGAALYIAAPAAVWKVSTSGAGANVAGFTLTASGSVNGGDSGIRTLAVDASGRLYVAGAFAFIDGQQRNGLARVAPSGALDTWTAASNSTIAALALDAAGQYLYLGGDFVTVAGNTHFRLARVALSDASSDESWKPMVTAAGSHVVQHLALTPANDALLVSGVFTAVNGTARSGVAKISTVNATLDSSWTPNVAGYDVAAIVASNSAVYFAGPPICCSEGFVLRVDAANAATDANFSVHPDQHVAALLANGTGNLDAFGGFAYINDTAALSATSLGAVDGTPMPLADFETAGAITAMAPASGGALLMAGAFQKVDQTYRAGVLRLDADGSLDAGFVPPRFAAGSINPLMALAVDPVNGAVYVGGSFTRVGGVTQAYIARLTAAGAYDAAFAPTVATAPSSGWVQAIALDQGAVYLGGQFASINGSARSNFAKLTTTGTLWPLAVGANGYVTRIVIDGNGIFVLGNFSQFGGFNRQRVVKLTRGNGGVDASWNPAYPWTIQVADVFDIAAFGGNVYIAEQASVPYLGGFLLVGEIARVDAQGTASPLARMDQPIYAILPAADAGSLLLAGNFYYQYALDDPLAQTPHPGGFAQISVAAGNIGATLPWSPGLLGSNVAGLGRLGDQVLIGGSLTKPFEVARSGIDLLPMPSSEFIFRAGFE
jgi:hypothetical protein